eukprot:Lithocolla_globosa_v1_NODE_199_length_5224_cov_8.409618.p8 type:complete len:103 gc:universal NODE_199_length_5224_cov_8.409618:693-385(-)
MTNPQKGLPGPRQPSPNTGPKGYRSPSSVRQQIALQDFPDTSAPNKLASHLPIGHQPHPHLLNLPPTMAPLQDPTKHNWKERSEQQWKQRQTKPYGRSRKIG